MAQAPPLPPKPASNAVQPVAPNYFWLPQLPKVSNSRYRNSTRYSTRKLRSDSLAYCSYAGAVYSILAYAAGLAYCAWAVAVHRRTEFLTDAMPIVAWKTLWAVDVCLFSYVCRLVRVPLLDVLIVIAQIRVHEIAPPKYALGICAAVGLIAGVAQIQRKLIVPWLCHAPIIIAKHLAHLTAVIAYSTQRLPIIVACSQLGGSLILVVFVYAVACKYERLRKLVRVSRRHYMQKEALQLPSMSIFERPHQLAITDGKSQADAKHIYDNEPRQHLYATPSSLSSVYGQQYVTVIPVNVADAYWPTGAYVMRY